MQTYEKTIIPNDGIELCLPNLTELRFFPFGNYAFRRCTQHEMSVVSIQRYKFFTNFR